MRREFVFPLIVGVLAGALIMMFWQFNARLNSASVALGQLEQASAQNTKTVSDVVAFVELLPPGCRVAVGIQRMRGIVQNRQPVIPNLVAKAVGFPADGGADGGVGARGHQIASWGGLCRRGRTGDAVIQRSIIALPVPLRPVGPGAMIALPVGIVPVRVAVVDEQRLRQDL